MIEGKVLHIKVIFKNQWYDINDYLSKNKFLKI